MTSHENKKSGSVWRWWLEQHLKVESAPLLGRGQDENVQK